MDGNAITLQPRARQRRRRPWTALLTIVLLAAFAANITLWFKYHNALVNSPLSQQQELMHAVGQSVLTPSETPVVSTVADKAKLTNPVLAAQVKNGDKILVYGQAKRLIVYRPSIHKVVAMLNIQTASQ